MPKHKDRNRRDDNFDEEHLKECTYDKCTLFQQLRDTARTHCASCGRPLSKYDYQRDAAAIRDNGNREPLMLTNGTTTPPAADKEHVFTSDCDIEGCPIAPVPVVFIGWSLYLTWIYLAKSYSVEWIAYLKGVVNEDASKVTIADDGMYFPNQRANGVHVDAETNSVEEGTIASIHSHVGMQAFFSKEDKDHFNHTCDMVINRSGDIEAVVRRKLLCGNFTRVKAKILFQGTEADVGSVAELKKKLIIDMSTQPKSGNVNGPIVVHGTTGREYVRTDKGLRLLNESRDIGFIGTTLPEDLRRIEPTDGGGHVFDLRSDLDSQFDRNFNK